MPHVYTLKGLFRPSYSVGRALQEVGIDGGATLREAIRSHSDQITYFVRRADVAEAHRLARKGVGMEVENGLARRVGEGAGKSVSG